jgi:hypothetical protein
LSLLSKWFAFRRPWSGSCGSLFAAGQSANWHTYTTPILSLDTLNPFIGTEVAATVADRPRLCLVVDTEEEFDWNAPLSRSNTRVEAMRHIDRAQRLFERFSVRPTYVVDYPVATQPQGYERIREWAGQDRCIVGAHLHPWVTPPFDEEVTNRNSFAGNLPPSLQDRKVRELTSAIESHLGVRPRTFKAGRYGIGAPTLDALEALEYDVDVSVNPYMDFRPIEGPDMTAFDARPFWFGRGRRMLEVPCTQGHVGWARAAGAHVRSFVERPPFSKLRVPGILARMGVVNQIMLSPEGNTLDEMVNLTRALVRDGLRVFSLTFHSPSVDPGHTPYTRSEAEVDDFLRRLEGYMEFFFGQIRGIASTPEDIRRELLGIENTRS